MAEWTEDAESTSELKWIANLFGGTQILQHRLDHQLDAHDMLLKGIPGGALIHLVNQLESLQRSPDLFEKAVGMSLRTFQRRKEAPETPLNQEQSWRTWKFAEVLAKATMVLGSQTEAELWLERPAIGLDQHRPIDLMATPAGVEIVEAFLERLEYGVYT